MNAYGEAQGVAADLELRQRLDRVAADRTAADHAIDGLKIIAGHAHRWIVGCPSQTDPTEAMRTIWRVAEDAAGRARAMQDEQRTEGSEWR